MVQGHAQKNSKGKGGWIHETCLNFIDNNKFKTIYNVIPNQISSLICFIVLYIL